MRQLAKILKRNQLEILKVKNTSSQIIITAENLHNSLAQVEKRTSKHEDRSYEISQSDLTAIIVERMKTASEKLNIPLN